MRNPSFSSFAVVFGLLGGLAWLPLSGCSSATTPPAPDGGTGGPGTVIDAGLYTLTVLGPEGSGACDVHASAPSTFTDTTDDWNLRFAIGSFYSGDLDHDGYPDMIAVGGSVKRETIPTKDDTGFHNLPDGGFDQNVAVMMNRAVGGRRTFVDETVESGLFQVRGGSTTELRLTQLAAIADVNNDGNPDVYGGVVFDPSNTDKTSSFNQDRNEILLNDGRGHFTLADPSDPSAVMQPQGYQAIFTDVQNDGNLDLLLTYWYRPGTRGGSQAQLFNGNGDGTFTSITTAAGLQTDNSGSGSSLLAGTNPRPSFGAAACDLDGDGYPELLISSYGGESNMLYANDGTGSFKRLVQPGGFDGDTITSTADNEMFLCWCTTHSNDPKCANAAQPKINCAGSQWTPGIDDAPALANGNNFSAACRDMDGDGKPDLFQSTIRHWWAGNSTDPSTLLLNKTQAPGAIALERQDGAKNGVTFPHLDPNGWNEGIQQVTLVDMNNDGRPDILAGGSDYGYQWGHLFIQQPDGSFKDLAQQWGLAFPCMDGLAVADYDRDGDLDVVVRGSLYRDCATGWPALQGVDPGFGGYKKNDVHIFTNDASEHAKWLELRLLSDGTSNKTAIGATVTVIANGVKQVQQVLSGHGIGSESDDPGVLFFGLGNCAGVDKIEVKWPNQARSVEVWSNVPTKHLIELHQGDPKIYAVNLK